MITDPADLALPPPYDPERDRAQRERLKAAWRAPTGWRYFSAVNNSIVGKWYLLTAFFFFTFAGLLALVIRAQLAVPDNDLVPMETYNQVFTMHGTVMMFLFAVPIFEAVAIMVLPEILGARDLPFPRLSTFGYMCFVIGGVFVCGSLFFGAGPDGGWFMYPPLSSNEHQTGIGTDIWLLGLSFIEVASIAAAIELIVGVLKSRPPGMRLNLMPLYCWYVLVVGGMILFAFPPLIAGDLLLEMERAFHWPFFDPDKGGDPLLWQHLFWIFGHPEVYIIFLPSIAIVATIIPTFAREPIVGHSWIVLSAVGVAFLSFGLWVHHMFATGLPEISLAFFSAASEAVAIPTGVQIFCFIGTVLVGRLRMSVPMLFATGALAIFVFGGLTGVMVALVPFDLQAHDSYFVVAHLHYTLIGGMLFPLFAGVCYWYPFATGKALSDRLGKWSFWLMFVGFNVAFLPMHWTGIQGMPRRIWTYPEAAGWGALNMVSTVGAFVLAAGFAVIAFDVLRPKGRQPFVRRNVWDAGTLEWSGEVPDQNWGIRSVPWITSRYPLWEQKGLLDEIDRGEWLLPDAEEGRREMIVTDLLDARPMFVQRVPGPTYKTLLAAIGLGGVFIFATYHWWIATILSGLGALAVIVWWLWTGTAHPPEKPAKDVGRGVVLPLYASGPASVGWWAMFITMVGDMTAFFSLVFAYFFYWTLHPDWPPAGAALPHTGWLVAGLVLTLSAWGLIAAAARWNAEARIGAARRALVGSVPLAIVGGAAFAHACQVAGLDPTEHAYPATVWVLVLWLGLHLGAGVLMPIYCTARSYCGYLTPEHDADLRNSLLYWHFMAVTAFFVFLLLAVLPYLLGGSAH